MFRAHIVVHPFSLIANLVSLMETGVAVRFPNLKIAFTGGGIAWVPSIMWRGWIMSMVSSGAKPSS